MVGIKKMISLDTTDKIFSKSGFMEILDGVWGSIFALKFGDELGSIVKNSDDFVSLSRYLGITKGGSLSDFFTRVKMYFKNADELKAALQKVDDAFYRACR